MGSMMAGQEPLRLMVVRAPMLVISVFDGAAAKTKIGKRRKAVATKRQRCIAGQSYWMSARQSIKPRRNSPPRIDAD